MKSCIYRGKLYHHRYLPRENRFTYTVFFMFLDLGELEHVFDGRWLWSVGRANVANFKRADYLGPTDIPLNKAVRDRVEQEIGEPPVGPIRMLTHLRYYGHCFNPVSFYYCYDAADTMVEYIVAEITNTPWRERYSYVLSLKQKRDTGSSKHFQFSKAFHVSPFMDMDFLYDWRFEEPGESLHIHMTNFKEDKKFFEAVLTMQRREISGTALAWVLIRFPAMTIKVLSMIYWQAFRLWLKKTPYYDHPKYVHERKP
ncbi:MAG: chromosome partitioning protein ParA [Nitrospira bacterium SG8_35_1]|nr:MAG: chromosome partitioning protein ParA [Nitrospira bacterium SG8_35_1]